MSMYGWAEQECRIACKKENPDFNFNSEDFDYGCSCYKSALKAYKSLCEDGHSGASFNFTRRILERLMEGQPLTPITDEDFFITHPEYAIESDKWLADVEEGRGEVVRMTHIIWRINYDRKRYSEEHDA